MLISYGLSLSTTNTGSLDDDGVTSLRQALSESLLDGISLRLDVVPPITLDLSQLGINTVRYLLLKSVAPFGVTLGSRTPITVDFLFVKLDGSNLTTVALTGTAPIVVMAAGLHAAP